MYITNEELLTGDWTKGPTGTGEASFSGQLCGRMELLTGWLAESWDLPNSTTMIFHIRKGVHWWNKAPTNGREVNANDVVWTIDRSFKTKGSWMNTNFTVSGQNPTSVKALDKYTVEVKVPDGTQGILLQSEDPWRSSLLSRHRCMGI